MLTVKNYQKDNFPVLKATMDKANAMMRKEKNLLMKWKKN